ncbi:MAG: inositol monophosphatase family protein [Planctomycetota bacterium]
MSGHDLSTAAGRLAVAHVAAGWAREAGELLLERFGRLESGEIRTKSSRRDLVTTVDVASERLVVSRIRAAFPDHAIEAEEEVAETGRDVWFVDPLDGTVNFVHGLPFFCVSIALHRDGVPTVAAIHAPRLGETFVAALGAGAFLGDAPIAVSTTAELADAVLATGFPYRRGELPNGNLGNFARLFPLVRGLRRMGSAALDLAYCAAGRLDAFWELHLAPHDVAAGALLVREVGGVVTDFEHGDDSLRGARSPRARAARRRAAVPRARPRGDPASVRPSCADGRAALGPLPRHGWRPTVARERRRRFAPRGNAARRFAPRGNVAAPLRAARMDSQGDTEDAAHERASLTGDHRYRVVSRSPLPSRAAPRGLCALCASL